MGGKSSGFISFLIPTIPRLFAKSSKVYQTIILGIVIHFVLLCLVLAYAIAAPT
jgi:hypothetical protein